VEQDGDVNEGGGAGTVMAEDERDGDVNGGGGAGQRGSWARQ
jgi:hypothetical protein